MYKCPPPLDFFLFKTDEDNCWNWRKVKTFDVKLPKNPVFKTNKKHNKQFCSSEPPPDSNIIDFEMHDRKGKTSFIFVLVKEH